MHFESAAEIMSKGNSSYKDLFWHAKTSNSKDPLPAQSSLLSSLKSCCTTSIEYRGTADPGWAPSEQWNAWRENPICENKQGVTGTARNKGLWAESPAPPQHSRAQQVTVAEAAPSAMASTLAPGTTKTQSDSGRYSPISKVLHSPGTLFTVSSCGRSPALLVGFCQATAPLSKNP